MSAPNSPEAAYQSRLAAAQAQLVALDRRSASIANVRGLTFLVAAGLALAVMLGQLPRLWWWGVLAGLAAYAVAAILHHRVHEAEARQRLVVDLNGRGLMRLDGRWHELAEKGQRFVDPNHPCTPDLDVFGQGSLFQLINETATRAGETQLARWLSDPAPEPELLERQGAARELTGMLDLRQQLALQGSLAAKSKAEPARFVAWAEASSPLPAVAWARPLAWMLPPLTLLLYLLGRAGLWELPFWGLGIAAQLLVVVLTRKPLGEAYAQVAAAETGFARYERVFGAVEAGRFTHPRLQALQRGLLPQGSPPLSQVFKRFSRRLSFAEVRQSNQLHPVLNLLTLWDLHTLFALDAWRREHGAQVRAWFDALAQLEALACLGGLAHDRPSWTWPTLESGAPRVLARDLGHPLLDAPVPNDVALEGPSAALLITGSNMSGKTTLLRAVGLNAVLALAGGPVCARTMSLSALRVVTAMRVRDSLEQGVSYFHAEVRRLKAVVDAATEARGHALFLLDEILTGTNTRDRQLASRRVLELLLEQGAIGAVTTHDLGLAALVDALPGRVRNVHFRDSVENGVMTFDYRMRDGVVDTTNALRVLALAGLDVPEPADGHQDVKPPASGS